jgi:hypothetical protein
MSLAHRGLLQRWGSPNRTRMKAKPPTTQLKADELLGRVGVGAAFL